MGMKGYRLWVRKAIGYGLWVSLIQRAEPHRVPPASPRSTVSTYSFSASVQRCKLKFERQILKPFFSFDRL
jgi:hypothetical protein